MRLRTETERRLLARDKVIAPYTIKKGSHMRSKALLSIMFVGLLNASLGVRASDFLNGTILAVRPDNYDVGGVFILLSGTMSGTQTCSYPNGIASNYYFISKNNPLMKELLTAALSAKLSEKTVTVVGKGTCTQGYEDVRYIEIS